MTGTLDQSVGARWAAGVSVAVVLTAALIALGAKPGESARRERTPPTTVVVARPVSPSAPSSTVPMSVPEPSVVSSPSTTKVRVTPPFQEVPDDPSASVPPPVRGVEPIGD